MKQSCCAANLALLYHLFSVLTPSAALCLFSVRQPTENSDVWKCLSPWPVSHTGQKRKKHHQWAKEVLEREWKPGNKKVFFPFVQRLLGYHTRRTGSDREKWCNSLSLPQFLPRRKRKSSQSSPENFKSPPAAAEFQTHDQSLVPWKF